ncbi:hypothetical protein F5Y14DRAFT_87382 [Nemania sp. NC0429]|nr:hypothetical protein F5Y14DRAFT_87382 [Nemania sp. NC0429]
MDDPWDWDIDRVVQELCTPNRSWHPASTPLKLPPLDQLEAALRENEVDGEVLLTYAQAELCAGLGIKILKHRSTFMNAVQDFRLRSDRYRAYRKRQASEFEDDGQDKADTAQRSRQVQDKAIATPAPNPNGSSDATHGSAPLSNDTSSTITQEQVPKKRRVAPTLVTAEIDPGRIRSIATEADTIGSTTELSTNGFKETSADSVPDTLLTGGYLGSQPFTRFDIVDLDHAGHSELPLAEDEEINIVPKTRPIPGRMIQTHRLMKRRLIGGTIYRRLRFAKSDIVPGSNNPDHDEVLPLYGDSDDDMEYDSDTWREIEAEKNSKQPLPKGLTADEIASIFDRVLEQIASKWREEKLPKYASKANRIWNHARRFGLKEAIDRARRSLHEFEVRIAKWKDTVLKNEYRNEKELEDLLSSFELSVFDREHSSWLIGILTSPFEPAKVSRPREPRDRPLKPQPILADDEEIVTSDSEDDLKDFIVDDEFDTFEMAEQESHIKDAEVPDVGMDPGEDGNSAEVGLERSDKERATLLELMEAQSRTEPTETSKMNLQTPSKQTASVFIDLTSSPDNTRHIIRYKDGKLSSKETPSPTKENTAGSPLIMGIADLKSGESKVANELMTLDDAFIDFIFSIISHFQPKDIWEDLIILAINREWPKAPYNSRTKRDGLIAYTFVRLFETYKDDKTYKLSRYKILDDEGKQGLRQLYTLYPEEWNAFIRFLKRLSDRFEWKQVATLKKKPDLHSASSSTAYAEGEKKTDAGSRSEGTSDGIDTDANAEEEMPQPGEKRKKKKKKKKRKEVTRNREAAITRELEQAAEKEREIRRKLLRERLVAEGSMAMGSQPGGLIVNESKRDDQGFICINEDIARRIKEHQVTGVRFMWDQLVATKKRQGCLLAHTMGLGKTMQVITLLVTIGQASASDDPSVFSQIPEDMRTSRTLILCPATLVNNWHDEMWSWLPENHACGTIFKVDAILSVEQRVQAIRNWSDLGGIMIIGYNLFKSFVDDLNTREIFLRQPNIVIADEAHMMKNPKAQTHVAAANFRTLSRVALTGSPLANNVEEYYSMINWVAPNYLGDIGEFRAQYANPIKEGLNVDSTSSDRRRALRMLRVLKSEVSPKVSRITIGVLKHDIPQKKEFVLTVPLTSIQRQAYEMFINYHSKINPESTQVPVFAIHDLSLICASPSIFLEKLKEAKRGLNHSTDRAGTVTLPQQLISDEMALLRNAERAVKDDFTLSWKVPILLEILGQSKKLGDYVLLFSHSKVALDYLENELRMKKFSFARLDGRTQMGERQNIVKRFNKGNIDIFLISTKAGALGLNITGANRVIIFDAQFNPQNEQQAVGRAYRIGQKKPVFVYRFVCGGTCEEKLLHQAIWKMQLASRVVDKKHPVPKAPKSRGGWALPEEPEQKELGPFLGKDTVLDALLKKEEFRGGIRAVELMDTFEEEAVEDAELSAEDVAMADQMILENEARRSGLRLQVSAQSAHLIARDGLIQPSAAEPPSSAQYVPRESVVSRAFPLASIANAPGIPHTFENPASLVVTTTWPGGVPASQSTYDVAHSSPNVPTLPTGQSNESRLSLTQPPVQLPGSEVLIRPSPNQPDGTPDTVNPSALSPVQLLRDEPLSIRSSSNHPNGTSDIANTDWASLQAIELDLNREFNVRAGFPGLRTRQQVASELSNAVWDNIRHTTPEYQRTIKSAIMHAASTERFVEGLCMRIISPHDVGQMRPEMIDKQLKDWKEIGGKEWKTKKESFKSRIQSDDPEHLQSALKRLSRTSNQDESNGQPDQHKSYRLDDREALKAVFERRKLKSLQKDDQEAIRAVMENRKSKDLSPRPPDAGKGPRLPGWAENVVKKAQISAPSSPAPPQSPLNPVIPALQPQPRTPFK